ncbi:hypothetical protein [Paenibacillus tyrfis]|uniref:hypothetical protein n=1 Tax=Paenibacillus tyrfis TaxID=1501230 RepID=UPI000B58825B|nr:hypothetical protein [Paenibacillus tyrfis]
MKYMYISLLVFLLGGCSPANKENTSNIESLTNEFPANDIRLIDIHLYRSDSYKTQPELINVFSDEKEKNNVIHWINTIHKRQDVIMPDINKIYVLQFHYPNGNSEISKYLAYVEDSKGNYYAKKFEMTAELFNYEAFTKEVLASVIEKIGEKDWFAVEKLVILTP